MLKVFVLGFLTSLLVGTQTVQAQYTPDGQAFILVSPISIISPSNSTYISQSLTLNFTVKSFLDSSKANITIVYSVDGKTNTTIDTQSTPVPMGIQSYYLITGWATLPEMPEGSHNITVYGKYEFPSSYHNIGLDNRTVYFTVNDGNPPIISNLSLENKTYNQDNLPLNFTVDEPTSWIGYCLDGQVNVTLTENTLTLTGLTNGLHNVTVYAKDTFENMGASETIYFSVAQPESTEPEPTEPEPTEPTEAPLFTTTDLAIIAAVAVAIVIGIGLLVYFKKRKH
ncbi:MAG: hypothetical protein IBV52_06150 [Candidatus Bathyarchaeota archaeon]